jgi:uncharacterized membrane protein
MAVGAYIRQFLIKVRNYFTTGLVLLAPSAISVYVLVVIFRWFDNILGKWYTRLFEKLELSMTHFPGLGALTLAILVVFIGFMARLYAGRKAFAYWDRIINRVPLVNRIYLAVRQISDSFVQGGSVIFQRPVLIEYPRKGLYAIGFVTRDCHGPFCSVIGKDVSSIFLPTTPNPTSGFILFVPTEEMVPLDMGVEDAMKLVISAGMVTGDIRLPKVPGTAVKLDGSDIEIQPDGAEQPDGADGADQSGVK